MVETNHYLNPALGYVTPEEVKVLEEASEEANVILERVEKEVWDSYM